MRKFLAHSRFHFYFRRKSLESAGMTIEVIRNTIAFYIFREIYYISSYKLLLSLDNFFLPMTPRNTVRNVKFDNILSKMLYRKSGKRYSII